MHEILDDPVEIENGLLEKWRRSSRTKSALHGRSRRFYKSLSNMHVFGTVGLSFAAGCINLSTELGGGGAGSPLPVLTIVSGCLALASGSLSALAGSMHWSERAARHDEYSTRYSELVREINTETCLGAHGAFRNEAELIQAVSATLDRLEENAPSIRCSFDTRSR